MVPNRAPEPTFTIQSITVHVGRAETVDVSSYFTEPDGEALVYSATSSNPAVAAVAVADSILTMTAVATGNAMVTVTARDPGGLTASQEFVATVSFGARRLTDNRTSDRYPSWSPDGTEIAFASLRDRNYGIYVMDADGGNRTRLTDNSGQDRYPSWSPDGTEIALTSDRNGNFEIYVMDADGGNQTRLTNNSADDFGPSWSPDGTEIAFASDRDGNFEIYVMDADGGNQTRLTDNRDYDYSPAWSPDGTEIAFVSDRDGDFEIYVMDADGGNQTRLTDNGADDRNPSWSPDGTEIAFVSDRDGNLEIYVMDADGGNQMRLTDNRDYDYSPAVVAGRDRDRFRVRPRRQPRSLRDSDQIAPGPAPLRRTVSSKFAAPRVRGPAVRGQSPASTANGGHHAGKVRSTIFPSARSRRRLNGGKTTMANGESAIIDPGTGQSLNRRDPDTEEARNNRLKYLEAARLQRKGDEAGYDRLMEELTEGNDAA